MKLRNKVLVGVGIVWLVFLAFTYISSKAFLLRSFVRLEEEHTNQDLSRIDQALDQLNYSLYTFTSDWSHWDDLYAFMLGKKPEFIPNNINLTAFLNSTINFLSYWDKNGKLVFGAAVDTDKGKFRAYPAGLEKFLYPNSLLLDRPDLTKDVRGYISLPEGIMMVAAAGVSNGDKTTPPSGAMVTGRFISPKIIDKLSEQTKLKLTLFTLPDIQNNPTLNTIFQTISENKNGHMSQNIDKKTLAGYTLIKDIEQKPIGMFRMTAPRSVYLSGLRAINYYLISFVILGVIFSIALLWLLRILVIRRLEKLNLDVAEIRTSNKLSRRVNAAGNDELSSVSTEINRMLGVIEMSQEQLENRVAQRTEELKQSNVKLEQEIIERKSVEKELIIHKEHLVRLAHYDSLTSLPNRAHFNDMLNTSITAANKNKKKLAILFIDLDRFKNINDTFGHNTGDLVLKEVAERFSLVLRSGDILARLGGDEFIILLNNIDDPKYAGPVAQKLIETCKKPVYANKHEFFLTTSIGICIYPDDGISLEDLQRNADMAMYRAKRSGGSIYEYFTEAMNSEALERAQLESALRKAINNNEFILHYQPKLNLADGMMTGAEALIRWESPELGMISPAKFIPLAEETGLILPIGEWTLREACRANKAWQDAGYSPICVAVNLSPKQFRHQDIAQIVSDVLNETKLDPTWLELEITETAIVDDAEAGTNKLNAICNMGVKIAIDDFGTGYTSISYLKRFPVSILKIDQSFVKGIPENRDDIAITAGVIALAHRLGIKVVAEGVETAEQLQFLADNACDMVQGYYLSRPLPEAKFVLQLEQTRDASSDVSA